MKKENYFLCQVVKVLDDTELQEDENVIKEKMMYFIGSEVFTLIDFKITNGKAIAICVCNKEDDFNYIVSRSSYEITKIKSS